jgi:hypothetical protein
LGRLWVFSFPNGENTRDKLLFWFCEGCHHSTDVTKSSCGWLPILLHHTHMWKKKPWTSCVT